MASLVCSGGKTVLWPRECWTLVCSVVQSLGFKKHLRSTVDLQAFVLVSCMEALLPLVHWRDVFVCMATGAVKKKRVFSWSQAALGVVISPLIGLMDQQVSTSQVALVDMPCIILQVQQLYE